MKIPMPCARPRQATRPALAALLVVFATVAGLANARSSPGDIDLHRMGWLPSDTFGVGQGMPAPTVNAIAALPDGEVWLGTMRGLARQSGTRIVAEPGPDGVLEGAILDLVATPDGDLLAATDGHGVWRRRDGQWTSLGAPFGSERVQRLRSFGHGNGLRVFAIGHGVAELSGDGWQALPLPAEVRRGEQFDLALEPAADGRRGALWVASYGTGLHRCKDPPASCTAVPISVPGPRTDEVRTLELQPLANGGSVLWVGLQGGGLARLAGGAWTRWHTRNSALPSDFVSALELVPSPTGGTEVWIGSRSGLSILREDGQWMAPDPRVPLLRERVRNLAISHTSQGVPVVWTGADGGAVRTPLRGPWHLVSTLGKNANGIWGLRVERAADDGHQRLWLASDGDGLARYEYGQWTQFGADDGLPSNTIRGLTRVPDGSPEGALWVGTWGGHVVRLHDGRFVPVETPWPKRANEAASLLLAGDGEVWASTRQQGVARWKDGQWQWWPADGTMPGRAYAVLRHGPDVWMTTSDKGLGRYRDGTWRFFGADIGLPTDALFDMRRIPNAGNPNVLWIGSRRNGLLRVDIGDPDRPRMLTSPALPVLPVSYVYGAVPDGRGDLLVCTDYGVFSWRMRGEPIQSTSYHREDGLPHDECNVNAMQVDDLGRVWIGTIGGAAAYTPPDARPRRASPLRLTRLLVDGQPTSRVNGVLQLPRPDSALELEYNLLSGEKEAGHRYRVSLLNGNGAAATAWNASNTHRYARLPAGLQRLRIEARDAAGMAAAPLELQIDVPEAWWRTNTARLLQLLALLLAAWGIIRLRMRQLMAREAQLRGMVQQRTAQLEQREAELRRANEDLLRLSYTDPLTGLGNRRRLFEALHKQWREAARTREPLGLLLVDLDHFKRYNDAHGHLAGDARLRQVSGVVLSLLPPGASASRYGGEEFCVMLPGHDLQAAKDVAERMTRAVAALPGDPDLPRLDAVPGSVSIGVAACIPDLGDRPDSLLASADRALYAAKAAGRNRVVLARP